MVEGQQLLHAALHACVPPAAVRLASAWASSTASCVSSGEVCCACELQNGSTAAAAADSTRTARESGCRAAATSCAPPAGALRMCLTRAVMRCTSARSGLAKHCIADPSPCTLLLASCIAAHHDCE
jgi:hypothetical protein